MTTKRRRYKEFFRKIMFTLGDRTLVHGLRHKTVLCSHTWQTIRTLSKDDDDGSENVGNKMNLRSFKLNRFYLDPLNMSNAGDFSWS